MPIKIKEDWIWETIPGSQLFEINTNNTLYAIKYTPHVSDNNHWSLYQNNSFILSTDNIVSTAIEANRKVIHKMKFFTPFHKVESDSFKWRWNICKETAQSDFSKRTKIAYYKNPTENAEYQLYAYGISNKIEIYRYIPYSNLHILTENNIKNAFISAEILGRYNIPIEIHKFASYCKDLQLIYNVMRLEKYARYVIMNTLNHTLKLFGNNINVHISIEGNIRYKSHTNIYKIQNSVTFDEILNIFTNDFHKPKCYNYINQ